MTKISTSNVYDTTFPSFDITVTYKTNDKKVEGDVSGGSGEKLTSFYESFVSVGMSTETGNYCMWS